MSLLSRLFGKSANPSPATAVEEPPSAAPPRPTPPSSGTPLPTPPSSGTPRPTPPRSGTPRPDPTLLAREDEERLAAALASGAPAELADRVLNAHSTKARQRAAEAVSDPDQLRELIRLTRGGKDNSVYRILTTKRDALRAADRAREARRSAVDALLASLARRSRLPFDPLYESALALFHKEWATLAVDASPEAQAQAAELFATMQAAVERHHRAVAAKAEQMRAAAAQAEAAKATEAEVIAKGTEALAAEAAKGVEDKAAEAALDAAAADAAASLERERARGTDDAAPPTPEPASALASASAPATTAARASDSDPASASASTLAPAPPAQASTTGAPPGSAQPLIALLRQAKAALDAGGTARAQRLRVVLAERLNQSPALPVWFDRQLRQLDGRLAELKDWKTFTVVPKRAELVQRMQSLIGADISPEELAQHIRRLQEEWRTLNRGADDDAGAEALTFREAGQRAYEPCKEHFARQAALRRSNQERREAILERLSAFAASLSGDSADWRHVTRTIVHARREWRDHAPVDNAVAPALQERLRAVLGELQGRLDAEHARNVAAQRALIERASRLTDLPDVRQAIEEAKELQKLWRTVGLVPREQSDALWDEFRGHCDAVFQRSVREVAAYGAALEANVSRARSLCEEVEAGAARGGAELDQAMQKLDAWRAEFDALELPREKARELRQRLTRAEVRCVAAARNERAAAKQLETRALFDAASAIRAFAYAQSVLGDVDAARAAAAAAVTALDSAPHAARTLLERQLATASAGQLPGDLAANESQLRLLCVRAELLADVPTPDTDLGLRRDYQLRRLVETQGLGKDVPLADLDELALAWFTVGPVEPAVEAALRVRLDRCRETSFA
jgi:hypothetical protein